MFKKQYLLLASLLVSGFVYAEDRCPCTDAGQPCTCQPAVEQQAAPQVNPIDEFRKTLNVDQQACLDKLVAALTSEEQKFNDSVCAAQKSFEEGVCKVAEQYRELIEQLKKFLGQEEMHVQIRRLVESSPKI